jgi:ribosomal-protein-alanine N-acetyltransferase
MNKWFPIRTARLVLREFKATDESDVHEYGSDLAASRFVLWSPNTPKDTHDVLSDRLDKQRTWPRKEVDLALQLSSEEKIIGSISLNIESSADPIASLGYVVNPRYWGQGYATEATDALLSCASRVLRLHRVWATCDVRNVASWRVMEKVGMRREAVFRRDVLQKGEWRDSYLYAKLEQ